MWCLKARRLVSAFLDQELDSCARSSVSHHLEECRWCRKLMDRVERGSRLARSAQADRKSTRLNSSHTVISYAVFCLKKKSSEYRCACGSLYTSPPGPRGGAGVGRWTTAPTLADTNIRGAPPRSSRMPGPSA